MFMFQEKPVEYFDKCRILSGIFVALVYILSLAVVVLADKIDRYYHRRRLNAQQSNGRNADPPPPPRPPRPSSNQRHHRHPKSTSRRHHRAHRSVSEPRLNTRPKARSVPVAQPNTTYYRQYTDHYRCHARGKDYYCIHYVKLRTDSTANIYQVHVWSDEFEYNHEYQRRRQC